MASDPKTLVRQLAGRDPATLKAARRALAEAGDAAVPALAEALADRNTSGEAADVLAQIGSAPAAEALTARLERPPDKADPKDHLRLSVAHALRRMARPDSVPGLVRLLSREKAATALAKVLVQTLATIDSAEALSATMDVFLDDRRFANADFIRLLEPVRLRPHHAEAVFPRAAPAVADPRRAVPILVLANAYHAAGLRPHPLTAESARIVGLLDSPAPDLGTLAAHTLGLVGDPATFDRLRRIIGIAPPTPRPPGSPSPDVWLQAEAALALARNGVPEGVAALRRLSADGDVGDWARGQLRELGVPERLAVELAPDLKARQALVAHLSAPERHGRPPDEMTIALRATRVWPDRDDPAECVLFRYVYDGRPAYGLAQPVAAAVAEPTGDLSAEDALAVFAGWELERQGAFAPLDPARSKPAARKAADDRLRAMGVEDARPVGAFLFGGRDEHLLFAGRRKGRTGIAIVGDCRPAWLAFDPAEPDAERRAAWRAYRVHIGMMWFAAHAEVGESESRGVGESGP